MQTRGLVTLFSIISLSTGCVAGEHENPFALYSAKGELEQSCGETGLLAGPETIDMRVSIRLVGGSGFHWDQGDGVTMGSKDAEGNFAISRYLRADLGEVATDESSDCQVEKTLVVEGVMLGTVGRDGTYDGFRAKMHNHYTVYPGTDCSAELAGEEPIADELPCTVTYDIEGTQD